MHCPFCTKSLVEGAVFCPHCNQRIEGVSESVDYEYEAFISYRHLPLDRAAAMKIQRAIEGFRIPKQLVQESGQQRLGKCFRDEDELPTSSSLSEQIENALKRSRFLIVVCGKHTRESLWVQREVELFSSYHGRDRVLIALAEGEPSDSFPELLLTVTRENAEGELQEVAAEPLAADVRDLRRSKFEVEKLRLIAPIVGCNFDDLRQRAKLRRNRTIAAIASGIAAVSLMFGGVSTYQQVQIQESYRQIQIQQSESLARESSDLLAQGDRYQALQVALAALPESASSADRPFVPAAQMALEQSLGIYPGATSWQSCYSKSDVYGRAEGEAAFDGTGLEASLASDKSIEVRETASSDLVCRIDALGALGLDSSVGLYFSGLKISEGKVLFVCEGALGCFDAADGALLWGIQDEGFICEDCALAVSSDGKMAAAARNSNSDRGEIDVLVFDTATGNVLLTIKMPGYEDAGIDRDSAHGAPNLEFNPDGTHLAVGRLGLLCDIDLAGGTFDTHALRYETVDRISFVDGLVAVVTEDFSDSLLGGPTSLEVFDSDFNLLWSKAENLGLSYDTDGNAYRHNTGVFGTWSYFGSDDKQLVVLFGSRLLLLDETTGEQVCEIAGSSNFEHCLVASARKDGKMRIFATQVDGTAMCRNPLESNSGKGGLVGDAKLFAGFSSHIQLSEADGRVFCSVWTGFPHKRAVFRFATPEDLVDSQALDTEIGTADGALSFNRSLAYKESDDALILADAETLEQTAVVPKSSLQALDWERDYVIEMSASDTGFLYVIGYEKGSNTGYANQWVVYQVGKDGSADLRFSFRASRVDQFQTIVDERGQVLLLLVRNDIDEQYERTQHVTMVDPSIEGGSVFADVTIPDVRHAWYGNRRVVAYCEDSNGDNARFTLYDAQTGEQMAGNLESSAVQSVSACETKCSIAPDGKTFAVACIDGLVRMFDTSTGSLLWETAQVPSTVQILMIDSHGNLIVQDAFGQCLLASGKSGDVVGASSSTLPLIRQIGNFSDDTALAAFADIGDYAASGFALISLDEQSFGPQSVLYDCRFISPDGQLVVFEDDFTGTLYTARRLMLDELIATGNEMAAGHELTDAERRLFLTLER